MTETFYKNITRFYGSNHSMTSPKICNSDFDGYTSIQTIADRIMSDRKIDLQYKRASENRRIKGE